MAVVLMVFLAGILGWISPAPTFRSGESDEDKNPNRSFTDEIFFPLFSIELPLSSSISRHQASKSALQSVVFPNPARPATMIFNETTRGFNFIDSGEPIECVCNSEVSFVAPSSVAGDVSDKDGDFDPSS